MKKISALLVTLSFVLNAGSQQFLKQDNSPRKTTPRTYADVKKAFDEYWKTRTKTGNKNADKKMEEEKEQFQSWDWFVKQRTWPSGQFPDQSTYFAEYEKFKAAQTMKAHQNSVAAANWSFIGPGVVPGNGGGAGRINCMEFDPNNSTTLWVGTACGGLWKSTNGGNSWTTNTDQLPVLSISDIAIDPTNPQVMYLGTGDKYGIYPQYEVWGHYSAGVLKSTDGGATWNATGMTYNLANNFLLQRLILDSNNPSILFAATFQGIFKTTDGGATWNNVKPGYFYDIEFNPSNHSILYAGDNTGLMRSIDGGVTWSYVVSVTSTGRTSIAVSAANSSAVYVWSEGGNLYYSSNSGVSFTTKTDPTSICSPYGYYDMVIEVSPVNANIVTAGGLDIALSTDGGSTWAQVSDWGAWPNPNYSHADNHAHKFLPGSSTTFFSCNDGGIFKTTNQGTSWTDLSNGINIKQYYRFSNSYLTPSLIYAGAQDNGTDRITGLNSANQVMGADGEDCLIDYTNDNMVIASSQGGWFSRSTDGAVTFSGLSASGCDWTSPIRMDMNNNNNIYVGGTDVFKSTDNGVTFNDISNGTLDGSCIYALEIAPSNGNYIYAATFGNIYRTTTGNGPWALLTGSLPVNLAAISDITISDSNPDQVWVTFSGFSAGNKVFYSSDGGATWNNVSGTLPNMPVNCIEYQNNSNDLLYIGTDLGVYYMDATMNDWLPYNTNLPNVIVDELAVYYPMNVLRAATYGRGIWESPLQVSTLANLDAGTVAMISPTLQTCDTVITPVVRFKNAGQTTLTSCDLHYRIDTQPWQVYNWSGSLATFATVNLTLNTYTLTSGPHTLKAYTANPNGLSDQNPNNDTLTKTFTIIANPTGVLPPVQQGFVSATFPPANWSLDNTAGLWSRSNTVGGYGTSTESAVAGFYSIQAGQDKIISPYVDFTTVLPPIRLRFDVAYAQYPGYWDTLIVDVYDDCSLIGKRIYAKGGVQLSTSAPTTNIFVPLNTEWRTDSINLDTMAGKKPVRFRFIAKSGWGNELYLDNINLTGSALGISDRTDPSSVAIFPNPATDAVTVIVYSGSNEKISLLLYDLLGNTVLSTEGRTNLRIPIDASALNAGVYLLKVQKQGSVITKRVSIVR